MHQTRQDFEGHMAPLIMLVVQEGVMTLYETISGIMRVQGAYGSASDVG